MTTTDMAVKESSALSKPLLALITGGSWCGPCQILEKNALATSEFHQWAEDNFTLLKLDLPQGDSPSQSRTKAFRVAHSPPIPAPWGRFV